MLRADFTATTPDRDHQVEVRFRLAQGVLLFHGSSGVGKTLALRTLAGLIRPHSGSVSVDREVWDDVSAGLHIPMHRRRLGLVPQHPSLFPFTSVLGNVGFGVPGYRQSDQVQALMRQFEIEQLAQADPNTLSGGERQRVAIARALAPSPRLLLMDEPFSSLDRDSRIRLLPILRNTLESLGASAIVVSHNLEDAKHLGARVLSFELSKPGVGQGIGDEAEGELRMDRSSPEPTPTV